MPKPVLSDSLFNANDVATAILDSAELSVTNQDFGVVNISSSITLDSNWSTAYGPYCFAFNGFVFVSFTCYKTNAAHNDVVANIAEPYRPTQNIPISTISKESDAALWLLFRTDGIVELNNPNNLGTNVFHVVVNGWYRYT